MRDIDGRLLFHAMTRNRLQATINYVLVYNTICNFITLNSQ